MAKFISGIQQKYTQTGGRRPFGITTLLAGTDRDGKPRLFQTDPAGVSSEWKAQAGGRNGRTLREFLEANYEEDATERECCVLACRTLLEVVDSGSGSIELLVVSEGGDVRMVKEDELKEVVEEAEKATEEAAGSSSSSAAGRASAAAAVGGTGS